MLLLLLLLVFVLVLHLIMQHFRIKWKSMGTITSRWEYCSIHGTLTIFNQFFCRISFSIHFTPVKNEPIDTNTKFKFYFQWIFERFCGFMSVSRIQWVPPCENHFIFVWYFRWGDCVRTAWITFLFLLSALISHLLAL